MTPDLTLIPNLEERQKSATAYELWMAAHDALEEARDKPEHQLIDRDFAALEDAEVAAMEAYRGQAEIVETWDGEIIKCALSGVPILADDEVLEDTHTDEYVLRCLVLPPRKTEEEKQMLPETEEA